MGLQNETEYKQSGCFYIWLEMQDKKEKSRKKDQENEINDEDDSHKIEKMMSSVNGAEQVCDA